MQSVLSSWKEVARHQGLVLAFPEELNAWIGSRTSLKTSDDEQQLHGEVSQLREERDRLFEEVRSARAELSALCNEFLKQRRTLCPKVSRDTVLLLQNVESVHKKTAELIEQSCELARLCERRRSGHISWGNLDVIARRVS